VYLRRVLFGGIVTVVFLMYPDVPGKPKGWKRPKAMVLHVGAAMSSGGRRLAELLDSESLSMYFLGVEVRSIERDESSRLWIMLGERCVRLRVERLGPRRCRLTLPSGALVKIGLTRPVEDTVTVVSR
jgi:hypothetical protein